MDDPYPLWVLANDSPNPAVLDLGFPWLAVISALMVAALSISRRSLDVFSPTRLLETLRSQSSKARFEFYFRRLDHIILASAIVRASSEVILVVGASLYIYHLNPLGLANDSVTYVIACAIPLLVFLVAFGLLIPRSLIHRGKAETIVRMHLGFAYYLSWALTPLLWPLLQLQRFLEKLSSNGNNSDPTHITEGLLTVVEEGERQGVLDQDEAEMIESIMEFRDVEVCEIMTPRTDMIAIDEETPISEALEIAEQGPSRIPVYRGNQDQIIGVFYFKDVISYLARHKAFPKLSEVTRDAYFIPETKKIGQMLKDFRREKLHLAVIIDEYGATAGLITIEDILEEIVGDIVDEYDQESEWAKRIDDTTSEVDARIRLEELNELLGITLPESNDFDTLGGFIFSTLGNIPKNGESLVVQDSIELEVVSADERRIHRVIVRVMEKNA